MKYRKLGKSGIKVSEIGFGTWTIALDWWSSGKTIRMLKRATCNFYEMTDIYGNGKNEKL